MASLSVTVINGTGSQTGTPANPNDLVRLRDLQGALSSYMMLGSGIATSQILGFAAAVEALVDQFVQDSNSIVWMVESGVALIASVNLAPNGYLQTNGQGISVMVGSGSNQCAPGNHSHPGLPILPVTVVNGNTTSVGTFDNQQIPANFQTGAPVQVLSVEVVTVPNAGILATNSGVQADFGPAYNQVARGGDMVQALTGIAQLEAAQVVALDSDSVDLTLASSPGFPVTNGMSFPVLYELATILPVGGHVGGAYQFDFPVEISSVTVTAFAPQVPTVLTLMLNGAPTSVNVLLPSGVPGSELQITESYSGLVVPIGVNGATSPLRWQCTSGAANIIMAPSQVDLTMSVVALSSGVQTIGTLLTAQVNVQPLGGLQITASGIGVIFGNFNAESSPAGTVAPGDHGHTLLHNPVLASSSSSMVLTIDGNQNLTGSVNVDPSPPGGNGLLETTPTGVSVVLGTGSDMAAAGNHTHAAVTASANGFMTPAMLAQLNASSASLAQVVTFGSNGTAIYPTIYCGGAVRFPSAVQVIGLTITGYNTSAPTTFCMTLSGVQQPLTITLPASSGIFGFADVDLRSMPFTIPLTTSGNWTNHVQWLCISGSYIAAPPNYTINMNVLPI